MKPYLFTLALTLTFFSSCRKADDTPLLEETVNTDLTQSHLLKVGNYWVYAGGYYNDTADIDSIYISSDTIISGKKYFVVERKYTYGVNSNYYYSKNYYRENNGDIIRLNKDIEVFPFEFDELYNRSSEKRTAKCSPRWTDYNYSDTIVTTSWGAFNVIKKFRHFYIDGSFSGGQEIILSKQVGIITKKTTCLNTCYAGDCYSRSMTLVRYRTI